ncbi:phage scaffolding protein [Aminipila sp.]|uniref:phage scaffolding protein n=1 Tax=Aminipila sp. TaxID=2060095 RepID=UPI00289E41FF|nr:phage scaffolding protein [Aminipila sp.]
MDWLKKLLENAKIVDGKLDIDALMEAVKTEFPKNAVPKETYNDVAGQLKTASGTIETLKKEHKDVETLQQTIKTHEDTIKTMKTDHEKAVNDMAVNAAIEKALTNSKAKHSDLLAEKFDREKIVVKEGTVTGVDEQLKGLKESYKDLFEEKLSGNPPASPDTGNLKGGNTYEAILANADNMTAEEIAAQFSNLK